MTQSNFQGKAQPPQPCGFKIQPPGSHCQLALSLGFVTVLALTSCPSKFGPPHWLGHGLRPCLSANLAGKLLRNPGRFLAKKCSGNPNWAGQASMPWPDTEVGAPVERAHNWGCQAIIWLHLIKPACLQKLNSTHLDSLYSTLPTTRLFHSLPRSALPQAAQCQGYPTAQSLLPPSPGKPSG